MTHPQIYCAIRSVIANVCDLRLAYESRGASVLLSYTTWQIAGFRSAPSSVNRVKSYRVVPLIVVGGIKSERKKALFEPFAAIRLGRPVSGSLCEDHLVLSSRYRGSAFWSSLPHLSDRPSCRGFKPRVCAAEQIALESLLQRPSPTLLMSASRCNMHRTF